MFIALGLGDVAGFLPASLFLAKEASSRLEQVSATAFK